MTPLRTIRSAARERMERLSRRDVLIMGASAVAMKAADVAFDKLVVDPVLEAEAPLPVPHERWELGMGEFRARAPESMTLAWDALQLTGSVPEHLGGRRTVLVRGDDDMIVIEQGRETGEIMWGGPLLGPLSKRPDRSFGIWRAGEIRAAAMRTPPSFGFNRAVANGKPYTYFDLIVPGDRVEVITADASASPARNPRSTAGATLQGSA